MEHHATIDLETFRENFKYYDDNVIVEIIDIFFNEYASDLQILERSISELDFDTLRHKAHGLKGVVSYMSDELNGICQQLELQGKENNARGLDQLFNKLTIKIHELVEDLKLLKKEYTG